jgi:hypothetical protein
MTTWPPGRSSRHAAHSASRWSCTLLKQALKNTASMGSWAAGRSTTSPHHVRTCATHLRSSHGAAAAQDAGEEGSIAGELQRLESGRPCAALQVSTLALTAAGTPLHHTLILHIDKHSCWEGGR